MTQLYMVNGLDGPLDRMHEQFRRPMNDAAFRSSYMCARHNYIDYDWLTKYILEAHTYVYRQRTSYRQRMNAIRKYWWAERKTARARLREALWRELDAILVDDLNDDRPVAGGPIGCRRAQCIRRLRRPVIGDENG